VNQLILLIGGSYNGKTVPVHHLDDTIQLAKKENIEYVLTTELACAHPYFEKETYKRESINTRYKVFYLFRYEKLSLEDAIEQLIFYYGRKL